MTCNFINRVNSVKKHLFYSEFVEFVSDEIFKTKNLYKLSVLNYEFSRTIFLRKSNVFLFHTF